MKIYTQTYDLAKASPHRFWVAPFSEFKIGIKILEKDEISSKDFTLKAGSIEFTPDEDKIDNFTLYTIKSNDTGFVEYTIEVEGVAEKLKLMQIVTDSTVFEIDASGGDVPADVATQTWVNSQISDFVEEDALTAYYTKSETSSATELADAFAGVGGAISAFDMSENPVWSKTMVENAVKTNTCLPQTIVQYTDNSISVYDIVGEIGEHDITTTNAKKVLFGTNLTSIGGWIFSGKGTLTAAVIPEGILSVGEAAFNLTNIPCLVVPDSISAVHNNLALGRGVVDFGNTRTSIPSVKPNGFVSGLSKVYVPDSLYDSWIVNSGWSPLSTKIHRHSELEAPYATSKAEDAWSMADATNNALALKVDHTAGGTAPEVTNITTYYESEYTQLSVDDPTWEPDPSTMYVILPDQV